MDMYEVLLCLMTVYTPEYFALPPEKTCEKYYKLACEAEEAYAKWGTWALKQRMDQAEPLKAYWWAAWWVTWRPAAPCARWHWSKTIWKLRQRD